MSKITAVQELSEIDSNTARIWAGSLAKARTAAIHRLHLYAFPCARCSGPVMVGTLGTRENDIANETDTRQIGAVCLACGCRPEKMIEPLAGHHFRPVEWPWTIRKEAFAESSDDSLAAELSQDADTRAAGV
jgi:hypothetical protein